MRVEVSKQPIAELGSDLVAVGLTEGGELPDGLREAPGAADAKPAFKKLAVLYPERGPRVLVVGLGRPDEVDAERLRVAAALSVQRAGALDGRVLAWSVPEAGGLDPASAAAALVDGAVLAAYRFNRYRSREPDDQPAEVERFVLAVAGGGDDVEAAVRRARVTAEAANRARTLQDTPANDLTPADLGRRAEEIAATHDSLSVEVLGPDELAARRMGGMLAVAAGSAEEPRLIVLRHSGEGAGGTLGLVGKAVTFDTGGISIKPAGRMHEMKMDMSGGAAVLEAVAAIAELGTPAEVVAVVPAVENMPSGSATRPGDVITQLNGKTVEVTNTDAEGRLILADALTYCVRDLGADRVVDVATLTGAVVVALGSTYAGLVSNDDRLAGQLGAAGEASGELVWRLPLHPEYAELVKGTVADLVNSSPQRKAGTIYAASFLAEFVDSVPWAHLDIAGTAWDVGREYVGKGASGFGVRLLVSLASELAGEPAPAASSGAAEAG